MASRIPPKTRRRSPGLSVWLIAAVIAILSAPAFAQELQVQVDECNEHGCSSETQTVAPEPAPAPAPETTTAPVPQDEPETHDYNLRTGEGHVHRGDDVEEETLELDLSETPEAVADPGHEHSGEHNHDGHDKPVIADTLGLSTVTTTGGGGFAGFGADFISGDEAVSRFAIPPFLIPIYVAAGRAYDVPWNVLAAINQIETDFGRIRHQVSYAGAMGWMQFMPGTWKAYGVDASGDGVADPFNPVDAIYAAARYLKASGAPDDMRRAVFAYNHADWYVDRVLKTASIYGSLPSGLLAETGSLAFGRFPLLGKVSYGDDFRRAQAAGRKPQGLWISGKPEAGAVATQNVEVVEILLDDKLRRVLAKRRSLTSRGISEPAPTRVMVRASGGTDTTASQALEPTREERGDLPKGFGRSKVSGVGVVVEDSLGNRYGYEGLAKLREGTHLGAELDGGDVLGEAGRSGRMLFSVEAAGGAPVDPRPLVDGYRLQEVADFYNAVAPVGGNPFVASTLEALEGVSGTQRQLAAKVLSDPGLSIYPGGREDIRRGVIDKRVLGAMLYLRKNGLELTVTSLRTGHSFYTASGGVSAHSFGAAMDIAAFNGQPVIGNQGPGSLTEQAVKLLMRLEGAARPAQLISLMNFGGPSFAMGDHHDHLHVGYNFQASLGSGRSGNVLGSVDFDGGSLAGGLFGRDKVDPKHEQKLSDRLGKIENPEVREGRGPGSLHVEAEALSERDAAERLAKERRAPLTTQPAAAGARLTDLDIPAGTREGWAIGTVDGAGNDGWAEKQTVLVRFVSGSWRVVGPPTGARGKIVNPELTALATVSGGRGYAVGKNGAVVLLRGTRAPLQLPPVTKADLNDVDAEAGPTGYAVGQRGTVLRLSGRKVSVEKAGDAALEAVGLSDGTALAAGGSGEDRGLFRRSGGSWAPANDDFGVDGLRTHITDIESGADGLWVTGGISDSAASGAAELPFAAHQTAGGWVTYCAGRPALAAVAELGTPTSRQVCDGGLSADPSDSGPARAVALTRHGPVVATSRGLQLRGDNGFQPLDGRSDGFTSLALTGAGRGWALSDAGELAYVRPLTVSDLDSVESLPLPGTGEHAAITQSPDGELLVLGNGTAALREGGDWDVVPDTDVQLRAAAFQDADTAWATDDAGALLKFEDGEWSEYGDSSASARLRDALLSALGGALVPATGSGAASPRSFAFAPGGDGIAVGGADRVIRLMGETWRVEATPATVPLNAAAATDEVLVAAGDDGTLVEDTGDGWDAPETARDLAEGRDFTAATALGDGTVLAVAGGVVLARTPDGEWKATDFDPLGVDVRKIAGYRDKDGNLRAVALVVNGDGLALLEGGTEGWQGVAVPSGLGVRDFSLDSESGRLTVVGHRDGSAVAASTQVSGR